MVHAFIPALPARKGNVMVMFSKFLAVGALLAAMLLGLAVANALTIPTRPQPVLAQKLSGFAYSLTQRNLDFASTQVASRD